MTDKQLPDQVTVDITQTEFKVLTAIITSEPVTAALREAQPPAMQTARELLEKLARAFYGDEYFEKYMAEKRRQTEAAVEFLKLLDEVREATKRAQAAGSN